VKRTADLFEEARRKRQRASWVDDLDARALDSIERRYQEDPHRAIAEAQTQQTKAQRDRGTPPIEDGFYFAALGLQRAREAGDCAAIQAAKERLQEKTFWQRMRCIAELDFPNRSNNHDWDNAPYKMMRRQDALEEISEYLVPMAERIANDPEPEDAVDEARRLVALIEQYIGPSRIENTPYAKARWAPKLRKKVAVATPETSTPLQHLREESPTHRVIDRALRRRRTFVSLDSTSILNGWACADRPMMPDDFETRPISRHELASLPPDSVVRCGADMFLIASPQQVLVRIGGKPAVEMTLGNACAFMHDGPIELLLMPDEQSLAPARPVGRSGHGPDAFESKHAAFKLGGILRRDGGDNVL
jgi:hypothetical protein